MYTISEDGRKKLRGERKILYTLLNDLKIEEHKEKYLTRLYYCKLSLHLINCAIEEEIMRAKNGKREEEMNKENKFLTE